VFRTAWHRKAALCAEAYVEGALYFECKNALVNCGYYVTQFTIHVTQGTPHPLFLRTKARQSTVAKKRKL
jgi:hypothetical protein